MPTDHVPHLTHQIAQHVAETIHRDTNYNINVMDDRGLIIGSSDASRVGSIHPGAVQALETHRAVEVGSNSPHQKVGINLPLNVRGHWVGVVGISGDVEHVRPLAQLVRTTVVMLVEQQLRHEQQFDDQSAAAALLHDPGPYPHNVTAVLEQRGIDLGRPVHLLCGVSDEMPPELRRRPHVFPLTGSMAVAMAEAAYQIADEWIRLHPTARVVLSSPTRDIPRGADRMNRAVDVAAKLGLPPGIQSEEMLGAVAAAADHEVSSSIAELRAHPELVDTLRAWIVHDHGVNATAAALNLHRNSLVYRLGRIRQITGLDPHTTLAIPAFLALLLEQDPRRSQ